MGYMSNKLIEVTEKVIPHLQSDIHKLSYQTDNDVELFDDIQNFIMDNGDMINDSPAYIAEKFSIDYKTKHSQFERIE